MKGPSCQRLGLSGDRWAWLLIGLGAALRLRFFLCGRCLWLDELNIANVLTERTWAELARPLPHGQLPPVGWLYLHKLFISLLGESAWALRLPSLLAGVAVLPLSYLLLRRVVGRMAGLVGLAMVAGAYLPIYYSAELKHYMFDVLASVLVSVLALGVVEQADRQAGQGQIAEGRTGRRWRIAALVAAGLVGPWFSHAVTFVLVTWAVGLTAAALWQRRWTAAAGWTAVGLAWAGSVAIHLFGFLPQAFTDNFQWLYGYWREAFWDIPPARAADLLDPLRLLYGLFNESAGLYGMAGVGMAAAAVGFVRLWRTKRWGWWMAVGPIALTLAAAGMHRYPFAGRLVLFLVPGVVVLIAGGLQWWEQGATKCKPGWGWLRWVGAGVLVAPMVWTSVVGVLRPMEMCYCEQIEPVVQRIAAHRAAGDAVMMNYWAEPAWRFYHRRSGLGDMTAVVAEQNNEDDSSSFRTMVGQLIAADRLHGRWWVVLSHYTGIGRAKYLAPLNRRGRLVESIEAKGVWGGLFVMD